MTTEQEIILKQVYSQHKLEKQVQTMVTAYNNQLAEIKLYDEALTEAIDDKRVFHLDKIQPSLN